MPPSWAFSDCSLLNATPKCLAFCLLGSLLPPIGGIENTLQLIFKLMAWNASCLSWGIFWSSLQQDEEIERETW